MTTPFTTYAFPTADADTIGHERTLPDRLADIKNVKDFGAKGDGVTDDWAAIMAAYDAAVFASILHGTVFFPPGTYLVSQPITLGGSNFHVTGVHGASTITGNFADYIIKRSDGFFGNNNVIEKLTFINQHASGGGMLIGLCVASAIRDCIVTANRAISTYSGEQSSFDMAIENCTVSPGANVSGSIGIMSTCDGPIRNCRIIGFETGMRLLGNEGCMNVLGCYFEQNITGLTFGDENNFGGTTGVTVAGCWFKDNGTAILAGGGYCNGRFAGLRIEASETVTVGGGRPQYGIFVQSGKASACLFSGIIVTGQYEQYGINVESYAGTPFASSNNVFIGVRSFNTSGFGGQAWHLPTTSVSGYFIECNSMPVYTIANIAFALEGDCFNVSDSNSATWGAVAAGGGSTRAKVRWNGTNLIVIGK